MRRKKFTYPVTTLAGSTPSNMIRILRRFKPDRAYYFKVALTFLVSVVFSILNMIEKLLWNRRIKNYRLQEPPVFIIGFNRSGTTLLHNLLCQDPKAGFTSTFQTVFPHCVLTQDWWLAPLINSMVPSKRPFDDVPMDMSFPQEEEFALSNLQAYSIYNFFLFPRQFDTFVDHDYFTGSLPAKDVETWKTEYRQLLIKSLLHTKGSRYIGKNPHHIPRVRMLNEMYPGCSFIFIYRDPYNVVESLFQFILGIFPGVQIQQVPADFTRRNVARFYALAMNRYFEEKSGDPSLPILEIRMEDFMKDKLAGLRNIYSSLGIGGFGEVEPLFKSYIEKNRLIRESGYEIPEETISVVNEYAREIVVKLGYTVR